MIKYTSFGAAQQVTGSMHLFQFNGVKVLLDCGLDYEKNEWGEPVSNLTFKFNPAAIDVLILSHSHIDHSGNIPNLVRQGFKGPIFCTPATRDLVQDLWHDSLNIQISENKKNKGRKGRRNEVLYSVSDIREAASQIIVTNYFSEYKIANQIFGEFYQAGHIPGAASIKLRFEGDEKNINVGFTGDIGNYNSALVADAVPMKGLDYLLSESTYGSRLHTNNESQEEALLKHIKEVCIGQRGKLVIPAFSIGRTQAILFTLHKLYHQGEIPEWLNIYSDSPLAIRSTQVYKDYVHNLNEHAQKFFHQHGDLFQFPNLKTLVSPSQSDYISQNTEPSIIVSAAGMLEGGRIQKHIRNNIGISSNRVLIAGYCAEGTLGDRLLSGLDIVRINRKERRVLASVKRTDVFSAHADQAGLIRYISEVKSSGNLKKVFLVHGDKENMEIFKSELDSLVDVEIPVKQAENILE